MTMTRGPARYDAHRSSAAVEEEAGEELQAASPTADLSGLLAEIKATWRMRCQLLRAEKSLMLQVKAVERQVKRALGDGAGSLTPEAIAAFATIPLEAGREPIREQKLKLDRQLAKLARQLPVYPWVKSVRGFGAGNLAGIVAETGDLALYSGPAKVWKRMGLAVIGGQRQRMVTGAEAALEQGYSPRRRSIAWNLGECLVKLNGHGRYRTAYDERKAYELERAPGMQPAIAHARAKRYAEKRAIRDLWRAWRRAMSAPAAHAMPPFAEVPAQPILPALRQMPPYPRVPEGPSSAEQPLVEAPA